MGPLRLLKILSLSSLLPLHRAAALAGELVERLGIRTQDTAAPDLFSAEQEGAAAELPEAE